MSKKQYLTLKVFDIPLNLWEMMMKNKNDMYMLSYLFFFGVPFLLASKGYLYMSAFYSLIYFFVYWKSSMRVILKNQVSWVDYYLLFSQLGMLFSFVVVDQLDLGSEYTFFVFFFVWGLGIPVANGLHNALKEKLLRKRGRS